VKRTASLPWLLLGVVFSLVQAGAVENDTNSSDPYNTNAPTSSDIANWDTGWAQPQGQSGITGWNYVGIVAGGGGAASGVYLGNGWVLTAAHVGAGIFTLGSGQYTVVPGSIDQGIPWQSGSNNYTADLTLFQIQPDGVTTFSLPNLPSLTIATSAPTVFGGSHRPGSSVAMIGYGDGGSITNETWGLNTVTQANVLVNPTGYSYVSNDFETAYGTTTAGMGRFQSSVTNDYQLVLGDSGGGDFIYDSSSGIWELAGINEALDSNNDSFMIQLSTYSSQFNTIVATPEPSSGLCLACGLLAILGNSRLNNCPIGRRLTRFLAKS